MRHLQLGNHASYTLVSTPVCKAIFRPRCSELARRPQGTPGAVRRAVMEENAQVDTSAVPTAASAVDFMMLLRKLKVRRPGQSHDHPIASCGPVLQQIERCMVQTPSVNNMPPNNPTP
jgi:hypothetical protein